MVNDGLSVSNGRRIANDRRIKFQIPNRTVFAFVMVVHVLGHYSAHSQSIFEYENEGVQVILNCIHYVALAVH